MLAINRTASWIFMFCLGLALSLPAAAQTSFKKIVVFGTSLSDPGNAFALAGGVNTPPDYLQDIFMVPSAPYARGGHHLTNGATWIERLARPLGLAGSVRPAFRGSGKATNYAVAGTRAYDDGINVTLSDQVGRFRQDLGGATVPSDWLFVVEIGSNDVRDALVAYLSGADGGAILQAALASIAGNLETLYGVGARKFLIWNSVPNIGLTPAVRTLDSFFPGAGIAGFATALAYGFSVELEKIVAQLEARDGVVVARLDVFTKVDALVADAAGFGLTNVTMPCITPNIAPFQCQNPDEYLFWDGVHPTTAVHAIIAQEAATALAR